MKPARMALAICAVALGVSARLAGQQTDRRERAFSYDEMSKAPLKAQEQVNPLENDPDAIAAGGLLYQDHCAECHGDKAQGGRKAPSLLVIEVQKARPGTIYWLLTNGVVWKGMPVWSRLPEPQRWQLVKFIKSLRPKGPPGSSEDEGAAKPSN